MSHVVLIHHVQGLTPGVRHLADRLKTDRRSVHTPDRFAGATFDSIEAGFAYAQTLASSVLDSDLAALLDSLTGDVVLAGISWGVVRARQAALTTPGVRGAIFLEACLPPQHEGLAPWPPTLPTQIHGMDDDEFFAHEGDLASAQALVEATESPLTELFTYPGSTHLFVDDSLPGFDAPATELVVRRARSFLAALGV